jgi:hypothetical protein
MVCQCGNKISGLIRKGNNPSRSRKIYFCNIRGKKWVSNSMDPNDKYKRGVVCENNKSMNIGVTDEVVWNTIINLFRNSHLMKTEFKEQRLGPYKSHSEVKKQKLMNMRNSRKKIKKELEKIFNQKQNIELSIGTYGKYVVKGVEISNPKLLLDKLEVKRLELVERLNSFIEEKEKIEEQGTWIKWLEEFNEEYVNKDNFTDKEKKELIEKLVEKIIVSFNQETQRHTIKLELKIPIVDDKRERIGKYKFKVIEGKDSMNLKELKLNINGRLGKKKLSEVELINTQNGSTR